MIGSHGCLYLAICRGKHSEKYSIRPPIDAGRGRDDRRPALWLFGGSIAPAITPCLIKKHARAGCTLACLRNRGKPIFHRSQLSGAATSSRQSGMSIHRGIHRRKPCQAAISSSIPKSTTSCATQFWMRSSVMPGSLSSSRGSPRNTPSSTARE